jgi:2-amino-4-hydroxy-6-hydroxymethyldihydropteridine diphosphokinase
MTQPEPQADGVARDSVLCFVALGANLGQPQEAFTKALWGLDQTRGVQVLSCSGLYCSEPFEASGPPYFNAVCTITTRLCAPDLLDVLQHLEAEAGRVREYHHQPRTLDLDLLFFGQAQVQSPRLVVPHPRWFERAFVLKPLMELAPSWVTPAMLQRVEDQVIERVNPGVQLWSPRLHGA